MPHQNQIPPPPTFNLPTTPLVTVTEEPPPIPSPKEKETEDKEQNNIILPPSNNQPLLLQSILKPTYKRKPLGDSMYWKQPAANQDQGPIMTTDKTGNSVKRSVQIRNCKDANHVKMSDMFEDDVEDPQLNQMLDMLSANLATTLQNDKEAERYTPRTYTQAIYCEQSKEWIEAMVQEINAHLNNQTWTLVPPTYSDTNKDKRHVKARSIWTYRIKMKNGAISSFKAQLCFDRSKVFKPSYLTHAQLASQTSVNTVLAIGAQWHSTITSGNVPAAYVQAELPDNNDTTYYMSQPQGFKHPEHPDWVCKLNKALYGHPRTGQVWQNKFSKFLIDKVGCKCCHTDQGIYILTKDNEIYIIPTVVNNTFNITTCERLRKYVHKKLEDKFRWKYNGETQWFLGCRIYQDRYLISMSQIDFLEVLLEKFKAHQILLSNTPMTKILHQPEEHEKATYFPYDSLVGSLLWMT